MTFARVAAGLIVVALCAAGARADDRVATAHGALTIHPIHHASLMLTWQGKHILVDPAPIDDAKDPTTPYRALPTPDIILITHIHGDHFNVPILEAVVNSNTDIYCPMNVFNALPDNLKSQAVGLMNDAQVDSRGVTISTVEMQNTTPERLKFHPPGAGNGYVLTMGGKRIYVAGDTEETPELAQLKDIDVAFIPMNLPWTETVEAAAKWVRDFKPKIVYPYHYRNADGTFSDLQKFKALVGNASEVRIRNWY